MAQMIDFFGYSYDNTIPSFIAVDSKLMLHRPSKRLLTNVSVLAAMEDKSYTPEEGEMGEADDWLKANYGIEATHDSLVPSTSATAGEPGSFDERTPADLATLQGLGALGNTDAWTEGQYVVLGDDSEAYWDGAAWAEGRAPAPA